MDLACLSTFMVIATRLSFLLHTVSVLTSGISPRHEGLAHGAVRHQRYPTTGNPSLEVGYRCPMRLPSRSRVHLAHFSTSWTRTLSTLTSRSVLRPSSSVA